MAFRSRASGVDVELGESNLELTSLSRGFRNRDEGDFGLTGGGFVCQYGASRKTWTSAQVRGAPPVASQECTALWRRKALIAFAKGPEGDRQRLARR